MNKFLKIAHKGYSLLKKRENTLFAFQNAIKNNFDMIELDIHLCKSNDIIIYHDAYLKYKEKFRYIKDLTYSEINSINPYIITLPFFFKNIDKNDIKIYLDLKGDNKIINPLLKYLNKSFNDYDNLILSSFNRKSLKEIIMYNKTITKNIEIGFITENIYTQFELKFILKDIDYLIVYWTMLDKETIDFCKKNNKRVFCYTLKDEKELEYIKKFDIDGIISDILIK
jgi:glycerophosphoryl diester phosphodiesterase